MSSFPAPVRDYLERISIAARAPAFLRITADGRICAAGGELNRYGLAGSVAQPLPEPWQFLLDFLGFDEDALDVPCIQVGLNSSVDLHLMRSPEEGTWVIILDARAEESRQQVIQQKTNELSLREGRQQKLLRQYVGAGVAESLLQQIWDPASEGERRVLTVLFADICGFTSYSEARPPGQVFRTMNTCLRAMIEPVTAHGGWVDKLIGDEVMALFGLLPSEGEPARRAVQAGLQIVSGVRALHVQAELDVALEVSVGIATGPVALGILGSRERRSFTAIGHHVNLAARCQSQAGPGELLIDEATFALLTADCARFTKRKLRLKGLATPIDAYSCTSR